MTIRRLRLTTIERCNLFWKGALFRGKGGPPVLEAMQPVRDGENMLRLRSDSWHLDILRKTRAETVWGYLISYPQI